MDPGPGLPCPTQSGAGSVRRDDAEHLARGEHVQLPGGVLAEGGDEPPDVVAATQAHPAGPWPSRSRSGSCGSTSPPAVRTVAAPEAVWPEHHRTEYAFAWEGSTRDWLYHYFGRSPPGQSSLSASTAPQGRQRPSRATSLSRTLPLPRGGSVRGWARSARERGWNARRLVPGRRTSQAQSAPLGRQCCFSSPCFSLLPYRVITGLPL